MTAQPARPTAPCQDVPGELLPLMRTLWRIAARRASTDRAHDSGARQSQAAADLETEETEP